MYWIQCSILQQYVNLVNSCSLPGHLVSTTSGKTYLCRGVRRKVFVYTSMIAITIIVDLTVMHIETTVLVVLCV